MKRFFLYQWLGNGKSEYQEVDFTEWETARAAVHESLYFQKLYSYPDALDGINIVSSYWAVFDDGVKRWESEFGYISGEERPEHPLPDDFMDLEEALLAFDHVFNADDDAREDVFYFGFDDMEDD